jgi:hypothetical protein
MLVTVSAKLYLDDISEIEPVEEVNTPLPVLIKEQSDWRTIARRNE